MNKMLAVKRSFAYTERNLKCLFCGKAKNWISAIICMDTAVRNPIFLVTVCPNCREKHTIQEMYEKAAEKLTEEARKILETWRFESANLLMVTPKVMIRGNCEVCGKRAATLFIKEQQPPFRRLNICQHCYDLGKDIAYRGWKIQ